MGPDADRFLAAFQSRDRRFAGRFFVGVKTTGVYCRPGCPAPLPRTENILFFPCAAAAEGAGFRACLRCRPETSPGTPAWLGTSATVSRALKRIADGEGDGLSMDELASSLGVGERHLRRLFAEHLGASPAAIARTRRLHFARRLLDETSLPMTQVALAAGYSSVRRFNESIRASFGRTPRELRRLGDVRSAASGGEVVVLRLPFRAPFDWASLLSFLAARALPGVESVSDGRYARTAAFGKDAGVVEVELASGGDALCLRADASLAPHLLAVAERAGRLFDLGADPERIAEHLSRDGLLARLVAARPGLRVPGAWDPFEMAVRAVLGQQISVAAARALAGRLVERFGRPLGAPSRVGLARLFPEPAALAAADVAAAGIPRSRAETIRRLARLVAAGRLTLDTPRSLEEAVARLVEIPGIGPWTAHVVAMRALGEPDAFPAGDLGLAKALARGGRTAPPGAREHRAEAWRPFRAYAVMHLWIKDAPKERT